MEITTEMVKHLEKLSALQHTDDEIESLKKDLAKMITMVDTLQQLDVSNVSPLLHMHNLETVYREDIKGEHIENEIAMRLAPESKMPYFTIPKVIQQ